MMGPECNNAGVEPSRGGGMLHQFKGVENFLKRIAFNLGNSPSQTEVKIISCIPIDVSDLQQKILCLEKQLDDKDNDQPMEITCRGKMRRCPTINACPMASGHACPAMSHTGVFCNTVDIDRGTNPHECKCKSANGRECKCKCKKRKSTVSFNQGENESEQHHKKRPYDMRFVKVKYFKPPTELIANMKNKNEPYLTTKKKEVRKKRNKKLKSHYVYYAQTSASPFNKHKVIPRLLKKKKTTTRIYLNELYNKQYKPQSLGIRLSEISRFSSPICRDTQNENVPHALESDMCSCCHRPFKNIDSEIVKLNKAFRNDHRVTNEYYDSTLYDVIPVKEEIKIKETSDKLKRTEPTLENNNTKYYAGNGEYKQNMNYNMTPTRNNYYKRPPKINKNEQINKNITKHKMHANNIDKRKKNKGGGGCIKFQTINPNVTNNTVTMEDAFVETKVDAQCLTDYVANTECQTIINDHLTEKSEMTLNQIKNILQSLLQEVKITTLTKGNIDSKIKKDIIPHKEVPQSNLENNLSTNKQDSSPNNMAIMNISSGYMPTGIQNKSPDNNLMNNRQNNFNRNDHNIKEATRTKENKPECLQSNIGNFSFPHSVLTNPYIPSCSKYLNTGHNFYSPSKCFQTLPVFIPSPAPPLCTVCLQNNPPLSRGYRKQATATATNTDRVNEQHSTETKNLIKEIYKTMALNMGTVKMANNSFSKHKSIYDFTNDLLKSTKKDITKIEPADGKMTNVVQAVSELFRTNDLPSSGSASRQSCIRDSAHQESVYLNARNLRHENLDNYISLVKPSYSINDPQDIGSFRGQQVNESASTLSERTSNTNAEFDITFVPHQPNKKDRKEKISLFNKMCKTVKLFKTKNKNNDTDVIQETEESSSESEGYQTVYRRTIQIDPQVKSLRRRSNSKMYERVSSPEEFTRNEPYMEQEYRRHWNEELMFDDNKCRYSSDLLGSGEAPISSVFDKAYEARSSLVEPQIMHACVKQDENQNTKKECRRNGFLFFKKLKRN